MNRPYLLCRQIGPWLVVLQVEPCLPANWEANHSGMDLDWDALAEQSGVPVSLSGDGLQLCARCGYSVVPGDGRFFNRLKLECFAGRVAAGFRYPAGAYLCATCQGIAAEGACSTNPIINNLVEGVSYVNQANALTDEVRH